MSSGKALIPRVKDLYLRARGALDLQDIVKVPGFYKRLDPDAGSRGLHGILIWGRKEAQVLEDMPPAFRRKFLQEQLREDPKVLLIGDGLTPPRSLSSLAVKRRLPILRSSFSKQRCRREIRRILSDLFPRSLVVSGGLLQVFGLGVLIIGDSGIGKSECALELISRGSRFISDDVTRIEKSARGELMGSAPELSRNFMEIRGLSIINIRQIYGEKAIAREAGIDLVINLKRWEKGRTYDRLGLESPEIYELLGVEVPQISIPVAPGRNIAILIEVACKVQILREKGYHAPEEITKRLDRALALS